MALRFGHDRFDLFDSGEHGAEGYKAGPGLLCYQAGGAGLSCAGRAPEYHGEESILFDHLLQDLAGTNQMGLTQHFVERARAHSLGQRRVSGWRRFDRFGKQGTRHSRFTIDDLRLTIEETSLVPKWELQS